MISIITTVHNHLPMNRLYFEYLEKYTVHPFELIIIDNASTDASAAYFLERGAKVIRNNGNYSYPHCQNQGIAAASYDLLAFFNNDLLVSPRWDEQLLAIMNEKKLEVVSFASNDRIENDAVTFKLRNKWKWIKTPVEFLMGTSYISIKLMHLLMYGNWEKWTALRSQQFGNAVMEGFSGSCIVSTRNALNKAGTWDERIEAADFDFYLRTKKRNLAVGDLKPIAILLGVFFHHYGRLTAKRKDRYPFVDFNNIITPEEKWGKEMEELLVDISR
ncbi:MAG: glycosyltransferase [Chitinophagales bacterium]